MSMVQVAEGGLNEIGSIVVRLRELGIQAASDTIGDKEISLLVIDTSNGTTHNDTKIGRFNWRHIKIKQLSLCSLILFLLF